jgi:hypothetical protein
MRHFLWPELTAMRGGSSRERERERAAESELAACWAVTDAEQNRIVAKRLTHHVSGLLALGLRLDSHVKRWELMILTILDF